jgi:hypothetical protein
VSLTLLLRRRTQLRSRATTGAHQLRAFDPGQGSADRFISVVRARERIAMLAKDAQRTRRYRAAPPSREANVRHHGRRSQAAACRVGPPVRRYSRRGCPAIGRRSHADTTDKGVCRHSRRRHQAWAPPSSCRAGVSRSRSTRARPVGHRRVEPMARRSRLDAPRGRIGVA